MKLKLALLAGAAVFTVAGAAQAKNYCGGYEPTECVNTMNPHLAERIRAKAQQGPEELRRFIERTKFIHALDYIDVAGAWYDEKSTYFAEREPSQRVARTQGTRAAG